MPIPSQHPRRALGPAQTPYGIRPQSDAHGGGSEAGPSRRPQSSNSNAHRGFEAGPSRRPQSTNSDAGPSMPKRQRVDEGDDEVRVMGQSTNEQNKKHKKIIKLHETIEIPSDEDEVEIDRTIIIDSDNEGNVLPYIEPTIRPFIPQPTLPPLDSLPTLSPEEADFRSGIQAQSTPVHSPLLENVPQYITIGK